MRGAYLVVSRGSRLVADATGANRPPTEAEIIVFTSDKPRGQRAVEDWGGLIINGQAPTNAGAEAQGEGDSGFYGGPDVNDDSGILRGVRIEFAGDDVTPADQLNGLAIQGVGAGTTISYVQIHYNKDDGIEPFGGTVSVDHLVVTGIGDDSVDGTDGYRGFMQFIIGQQRGADADQGFEISNNGDDGTATPKSTAVLANATMIGANSGRGDRGHRRARVRQRHAVPGRLQLPGVQLHLPGFRRHGALHPGRRDHRERQQPLGRPDRPHNDPLRRGPHHVEQRGSRRERLRISRDCGGGSTAALNKQFFETAGLQQHAGGSRLRRFRLQHGHPSSPPDFTLAAMPGRIYGLDLGGIAFDGVNLVALAGRTDAAGHDLCRRHRTGDGPGQRLVLRLDRLGRRRRRLPSQRRRKLRRIRRGSGVSGLRLEGGRGAGGRFRPHPIFGGGISWERDFERAFHQAHGSLIWCCYLLWPGREFGLLRPGRRLALGQRPGHPLKHWPRPP